MRGIKFFALGGAIAALGAGTLSAQAQDMPRSQELARRLLGNLLSTGGYFPTDASGKRALGDAKFYNQQSFFVRPKRLNSTLALTGGVEWINLNDRFFPFTGGNQYVLLGPVARLTTAKSYNGLRPYVTAGLYFGQLRSERLGFDRAAFTPSVGIGADWKFGRYFTLSAEYRIAQHINGVNMDGFSLNLRIF